MIVHMIGNAHIQIADTWALNAGKDEALATLRSAVERCEEYPAFRFSFGDVWAIKLVENVDPKLFKRIRKLIKKGQWNITHGCYSQPLPELMSGDHWERQVAIGHTYCLDKFGKTPAYYVNFEAKSFPISFYHNLLKAGYKAMVFFMDGNEPENTPSSIFRWVNEGGQELLCYRISPHYRTRSHELYGQIMESVESASLTLGHTLCYYGVGNHGGGPTKENIEYILEHREAFENVELKFSTLDEFFSDALLMSDSFPIHEGPIGDSAPGHLLNRQKQRLQQRRAENLIIQAERLVEQLGDRNLIREVDRGIDELWQNLLLSGSANLAHGKTTSPTNHSVDLLQQSVAAQAADWIWRASRVWSRNELEVMNYQQIVVLNTSEQPIDTWIEHEPNLDLDSWGKRELCDSDGNPIPYQVIHDGTQPDRPCRLLFRTHVPPKESSVYLLREFPDIMVDAGGVESLEIETQMRALKTTIENEHWTIRMSPRSINRIAPFAEKDINFLGKLGFSFNLYQDPYDLRAYELTQSPPVFVSGMESEGWETIESNQLCIRVENRGKIGHSPFVWSMSLYQDDERIHHQFRIAYSQENELVELNMQLAEEVEKWSCATSSEPEVLASSNQIHSFHGWCSAAMPERSISVLSNDFTAVRYEKDRLSFLLLRPSKSLNGGSQTEVGSFSLENASDFGMHEFNWLVVPGIDASNDRLNQELSLLKNAPIVFDRYEGLNRPAWENSPPEYLHETNEKRSITDGQMKHLSP